MSGTSAAGAFCMDLSGLTLLLDMQVNYLAAQDQLERCYDGCIADAVRPWRRLPSICSDHEDAHGIVCVTLRLQNPRSSPIYICLRTIFQTLDTLASW